MKILYRVFFEFDKTPNYIARLKNMSDHFMILVDEHNNVVDFIDPIGSHNKYIVNGKFVSQKNFYIMVTPTSHNNNYLLDIKDENDGLIKPISMKFYSHYNSVFFNAFIQTENKDKCEYIENNHELKTMSFVQITCNNASNIENVEVYF